LILGYAHSAARKPDAAKVDTQKHGIVTTIGSVVFDEKGGSITVTLEGPPKSTVTLDKTGVALAFEGPPKSSIKIDAKGITLEGPTVTINATTTVGITATAGVGIGAPATTVNGKPLVLGSFITDVFDKHVHANSLPIPPGVPTTTPVDKDGNLLPTGKVTDKP
jgi:hypothetical protein